MHNREVKRARSCDNGECETYGSTPAKEDEDK